MYGAQAHAQVSHDLYDNAIKHAELKQEDTPLNVGGCEWGLYLRKTILERSSISMFIIPIGMQVF